MTKEEVLEQRKKIVQEQLVALTQVREVLTKNLLAPTPNASWTLEYAQALEIVINAEGRALQHIDAAFNA